MLFLPVSCEPPKSICKTISYLCACVYKYVYAFEGSSSKKPILKLRHMGCAFRDIMTVSIQAFKIFE